MTFRVLADENVNHRVVNRLEHYGHDVEHVDFVPELGKGSDDEDIARHSVEDGQLLLTSDDDFLTDFDDGDYRGLLFIGDETLSSELIADIVHTMSEVVGQTRSDGVFYVSQSWL
jgi:hypothetical protein